VLTSKNLKVHEKQETAKLLGEHKPHDAHKRKCCVECLPNPLSNELMSQCVTAPVSPGHKHESAFRHAIFINFFLGTSIGLLIFFVEEIENLHIQIGEKKEV
jgi:hypothetical protein